MLQSSIVSKKKRKTKNIKTHKWTTLLLHWVTWSFIKMNMVEFTLCFLFYLLINILRNLFDADTKSLLLILLFLAWKCILLWWSVLQVLMVNMWTSDLLPLEKLPHDLNHKSDRFLRLWKPAYCPTELWHVCPWKAMVDCFICLCYLFIYGHILVHFIYLLSHSCTICLYVYILCL